MSSNTLDPQNWIINYSDMLYAFTQKRVNNKEQAEDIVQDVFLSAWKAKESYNGVASEKTWLFTVCKNKIIDYYRKHSKASIVSMDNSEDDEYFSVDRHFKADLISKKDWDSSTSNIEKKEFYNILSLCKAKLKQLQQQVFAMKYLEDIDTDEICEVLGISNQNYWVLMHRAKIQLRTCLEKNWVK